MYLNILNQIGRNIRIHRQRRGLSQEQLALSSGLNTSYLGQIERAEKNPTILTLEKVANALDLTIGDFINEVIVGTRGEAIQNHTQMLAILTHDDIKKYIHEVIKDGFIK
jgi:transcriptional regulator with XRE-family HTH domain